jgi:hypothetical protein
LNAAFFGEFGRDFHKGVRRLLSNPFGAIGQVALVEVFEKPPIV